MGSLLANKRAGQGTGSSGAPSFQLPLIGAVAAVAQARGDGGGRFLLLELLGLASVERNSAAVQSPRSSGRTRVQRAT